MNEVYIITMEDALLEVPLQRVVDNKVYSDLEKAIKALESILDSLPDNGMNNEEHFRVETIELI
jgi:hypothetical protein